MRLDKHLAVVLMTISAVAATTTPTPSVANNARACPADSTSSRENNVFGVSTDKLVPTSAQALAPALELRGGELVEAETLQEVDAIVLKAALKQQLVVIDFTATWCGPCKAIAPVFKELSQEMSNVVFLKVDVDENPETAAKYSVSAMPTFVFIKQGEVVDRLMGANPARLKEMVEELE